MTSARVIHDRRLQAEYTLKQTMIRDKGMYVHSATRIVSNLYFLSDSSNLYVDRERGVASRVHAVFSLADAAIPFG